jgi:hypothetical protein
MTETQLASIPAITYTLVSVLLVVVAWARRSEHPVSTHRFMIALMTISLGVGSFVAWLALVGVIKDQGTITFWAALSRTTASLCGIFVAYKWWTKE